jgi:hypothetical protein
MLPSLDLDDSNHSLLPDFSPHSCASPSPSDASSKLFSSYPDAIIGSDQFFFDTSSLPISDVGLYMPQSLEFTHARQTGMPFPLAEDAFSEGFRTWGQPATALGAAGVANSTTNTHRRQESADSIGSTVASPSSTYRPARLVDYDLKGSNYNINHHSSAPHLPTPTGTPIPPDAMMHPNKNLPPLAQSIGSAALSPMAMNTGLLGPRQSMPDMVHMGRPASSL